MVLNAYIIYKERIDSKAMNRLDFISNIIFEIECEWMKEKKAQVFQHGNVREKTFGLVKLPQHNLQRCVVCSTKNDVKRSHLLCVQCKKGVHPLCFDKHRCYKL